MQYKLYTLTFPNRKKYVSVTTKDTRKYTYSNKRLNADIKKFGWSNIKYEVVFETTSKEHAEYYKTFLIEKYRTTDPKHGYNCMVGGKMTENAIVEFRKVCSPTNKSRCKCLENWKTYESIAEAARDTGANKDCVQKSCASGGKASANGKHFIYADEKRHEIATRNQALKESEYWEWEW